MAIETIERDCQLESEATPAPATIQYWSADLSRDGVASGADRTDGYCVSADAGLIARDF